MPFPDMSSSNPYGLSGPELASVTNGGNYGQEESAASRTSRLQTQLVAGQARINKLQGLAAAGHTTEPAPAPLPAQFQAGGKFALSAQEQQAAMAATAPSTQPLAQQLEQKYQQVAAIQKELQSTR